MGDPVGIGPEITAKAWLRLKDNSHAAPFFLIAPLEVAENACRNADLPAPQIISAPREAIDVFPHALPVLPLSESRRAQATISAIETAVALTLSGAASAVVTNPIAKSVLYDAGFTHPGHTEFLGTLTKDAPHSGPRGPVMMVSGGGLSVALATIHMALYDVPSALSQASIEHTARVMHSALQSDFGITAPRIAMTGLNPHAGESGAMGDEEERVINPAAMALRAEGIDITDAQPADTLFHAEARQGYDAVLAMYHDQGLIPVKTLDFHGGVNITLGLPIIRTSPDHGTAFNIAGKGIARADSLIAALKSAGTMAAHRKAYHA